jgi:hypothetical protein
MLLYLQPLNEGEQRRCFVTEPATPGSHLTELKTDSVSVTSAPDETTAPVCVHLAPTVTSIYLARE